MLDQKPYRRPADTVLSVQEENGAVRCLACAQRCLVRPGKRGICRVRYNEDGVLYVPFGYVTGMAPDPVEKKPFYHFLPGSVTLSFGMAGCNFHCPHCQNWQISQIGRTCEPERMIPVAPEDLVTAARQVGARLVVSTYNEPLITAEWALAIFELARAEGLRCAMVSNGYASRESIARLSPVVDAYKIDLKGFDERHYRQFGGRLQPVLDSIAAWWATGTWVEVVTLVIPGVNDDPGELRALAKFLYSVSPDIPWHVTAFHPAFRMTDTRSTPAATLQTARKIGLEEGLRYVYAGNLPGDVDDAEHTRCPSCGTVVVQRYGFRVLANEIREGRCPKCRNPIAGVWD